MHRGFSEGCSIVVLRLDKQTRSLWNQDLQICRSRTLRLGRPYPPADIAAGGTLSAATHRGSFPLPSAHGAGRPRDFARISHFQTGLTVLTELTAETATVDRVPGLLEIGHE